MRPHRLLFEAAPTCKTTTAALDIYRHIEKVLKPKTGTTFTNEDRQYIRQKLKEIMCESIADATEHHTKVNLAFKMLNQMMATGGILEGHTVELKLKDGTVKTNPSAHDMLSAPEQISITPDTDTFKSKKAAIADFEKMAEELTDVLNKAKEALDRYNIVYPNRAINLIAEPTERMVASTVISKMKG